MTIDDDWDVPLTLTDYVAIVSDDLDEAVDKLSEREINELCRAVRDKIERIAAAHLEQAPAPEERRDRWWDR